MTITPTKDVAGFVAPSLPPVTAPGAAGQRVRRLAAAAFVISFGLGLAPAVRADGPAVDGINGKVFGLGGRYNGLSKGAVGGSVSAPVSHRFGAQFDIAAGAGKNNFRYVVAGHLFWRNPDTGLIGPKVTFGRNTQHDLNTFKAGLEAEYYLEDFTFRAEGGYQGANLQNGGFARIDLYYYPQDDLLLKLGGKFAKGPANEVATLGVEYQFGFDALPGLAVFADGAAGQDGFTAILGGFRIYFSAKRKSLKRRHREDDPPGEIPTGPDGPTDGGSSGDEGPGFD